MYIHVGSLSVSVDALSTTSLTISWSLASDLSTTTDYTISYSNSDTECFTTSYDDITTSQTTYQLTGLEEGTNYTFTVTITLALSGGRTGDYSANTTITTMTAG